MTISASGGGASEEVYSTEETWIGTLIDGKPIYRKVSDTVASSEPNAWGTIYSDENIQEVTLLRGFIQSTVSPERFLILQG